MDYPCKVVRSLKFVITRMITDRIVFYSVLLVCSLQIHSTCAHVDVFYCWKECLDILAWLIIAAIGQFNPQVRLTNISRAKARIRLWRTWVFEAGVLRDLKFFPNLPTHNENKRNSLVRTVSFTRIFIFSLGFFPACASRLRAMHNSKGNIMDLKIVFWEVYWHILVYRIYTVTKNFWKMLFSSGKGSLSSVL